MTDAFIVDGNGAQIPARGFGTFQLRDDVCRTAVRAAIEAGYRHIDTAAMYGNESEVGDGVRDGGVAREDLFITTKVWTDDIAEEDLLVSAKASLQRLDLKQVDLLLIHWPNRNIPLESSMRGLCRARKEGLARYIGVSNFPVALLERAVRLAAGHGEKLTANQCEYHPRLDQSKVIAACRAYQMAFTSYSPLGRGDLVRHETIDGIARRLGRKPSQIILRWHLQQGVVAIPRSSTPAHIAENFALEGFELAASDMSAISALRARDGRLIMPSFAPEWDV
ncbi:MAG: 2,5-didehydrogluconate reductase [Hyphomicrobiales bacterium]|nr:2,5-didehydrogluconate reductase [Hyphomicrobiales bacterium]